MKKLLLSILALLFLTAPVAFANSGGSISATAVAATTDLDGNHVLLSNTGSKTVYISVTAKTQAVVAATTSSFPLVASGSIVMDSTVGFTAISTICGGSDSSTVTYLVWE